MKLSGLFSVALEGLETAGAPIGQLHLGFEVRGEHAGSRPMAKAKAKGQPRSEHLYVGLTGLLVGEGRAAIEGVW